ncbi:hypothetical protein C5167_000505 [Papaver somniferum]|uniref:Fe2OG dioxygenase domain-containing protein n=1 Tax=Papaver somniferum TaxID=3469 RepID=A0A4Y7KWV0_PAPSO|nr:1-aminocyclopropane-1-carboxylate oxidase homolog 1-like [Papaver somniferum]RZC76439.1 hypothetical protein C5167_000505 [Papaver somniferum]
MEEAYNNVEKSLKEDESCYDRLKELKAFDDTKAGVKGLADSGLLKLPRIFVLPPEKLVEEEKLIVIDDSTCNPGDHETIPVIDLKGMENQRMQIVDEVRRASETMGFFQLLNHGIPKNVMEEAMKGLAGFHEQDSELKKKFYTRELSRRVKFYSNVDFYESDSARWQDTLNCAMLSPDPIDPRELPDVCRDILVEFTEYITKLGDTLAELLSEALGLKRDHLKGMDCTKFLSILTQYYPACPEPKLTLGASKHTDPTFFTVLLKGQVDSLQIFYKNQWIAVKPLPGALLVNVGDLLQLISNDKFKSVPHRVVSSEAGPRISVASFFATSFIKSTKLYGPIKELISDENGKLYKDITLTDYMQHYYVNSRDHKAAHALAAFKM